MQPRGARADSDEVLTNAVQCLIPQLAFSAETISSASAKRIVKLSAIVTEIYLHRLDQSRRQRFQQQEHGTFTRTRPLQPTHALRRAPSTPRMPSTRRPSESWWCSTQFPRARSRIRRHAWWRRTGGCCWGSEGDGGGNGAAPAVLVHRSSASRVRASNISRVHTRRSRTGSTTSTTQNGRGQCLATSAR